MKQKKTNEKSKRFGKMHEVCSECRHNRGGICQVHWKEVKTNGTCPEFEEN